jgi:glutamate/tyrosine decarboxylase-like PLP-dependent enzyme
MPNELDLWDWSSEEIKRVGYRVVDLIAEHLSSLPERPVFAPVPPELATVFLQEPAPQTGRDPDDILDLFRATIEPYPFGNGHPRFFGWVNSPPTVMGIFADALAAAMNPSCAGGNHAAVYVERQVINWFKQMLGYPTDAFGLLVSGGSMAALTALTVARHAKCGFDVRAKGLREAPSQMVFYRSGEGHGCHQKAVELLGIGSDHLRTIDHDDAWRIRPDALAARIKQDRQDGLTPVAVIASAGTVNTGAIDPLDAIAEVCREYDVWLHIDGAYGAPAILSERYESSLAAISLADSVALDPHKWLCVPVEAGLVLIRHPETQRAAFSLVPPYLRTDGSSTGVGGPPWFSEYGFQQTRGFRALKVWMSLLHYGLEGYRAAVTRTLDLATTLTEMLRLSDDFEVCEPQNLGIVCFRFRPRIDGTRGESDLDTINRVALEQVQLAGDAFVSSTSLNGVFWLRACVLNPRTTVEDLHALLGAVRAAVRVVDDATTPHS